MRVWNREPFVDMTTVLTEGHSGKATLQFRKLDQTERAFGQMRGCSDPGETVVELYINGSLMMNDTPDEQSSNHYAWRSSHGDVLIGGLGMGFLLLPILRKPEVEHVTVIEVEQDVINLIGPQINAADNGSLAGKLQIVNANVLTWKPPKGTKYNTIWMDIWKDICAYNLKQYATLNRRFGHYLNREDPKCWMGAWKQEWLRSYIRRERARRW